MWVNDGKEIGLDYLCTGNSCILLFTILAIFILVFLSSVFVLFPFYRISFRSNRIRDDEVGNSSVFYITLHFYRVVIFMEVCYLVNIVSTAVVYFTIGVEYIPILEIFTIIFTVSYTITITVTMMENILLSMLAIYRFSLYFFPSSETFFTTTLNLFRQLTSSLYILIFLVHLLQRLAKAFVAYESLRKTGTTIDFDDRTSTLELFDTINQRVYIVLTLFQLFSAFLYLPMVCSIRKMGRLQSAKTSQPEKYILYQTFFLVVFRLLYIPCIIFLCFYRTGSGSTETKIWYSITIVDICINHFIIQASYLSCNKKHVETLFKLCGAKKNGVADLYTKQVDASTVATN